MPYRWLNPTKEDLTPCMPVLSAIDRKGWSAGRKNLYATFYIQQRSRYEKEGRLKDFSLDAKDMKSWRRMSAFKKLLAQIVEQEKEKFRAAGMVSTIAATLVFFFVKAIWSGEYFINFSVDAVVGIAALFLLIIQLRIKYREAGMYGSRKDYILPDVLAGLLCLLFKIFMPPYVDFSLFILLMDYFLEKKRFFRTIDEFAKDN